MKFALFLVIFFIISSLNVYSFDAFSGFQDFGTSRSLDPVKPLNSSLSYFPLMNIGYLSSKHKHVTPEDRDAIKAYCSKYKEKLNYLGIDIKSVLVLINDVNNPNDPRITDIYRGLTDKKDVVCSKLPQIKGTERLFVISIDPLGSYNVVGLY